MTESIHPTSNPAIPNMDHRPDPAGSSGNPILPSLTPVLNSLLTRIVVAVFLLGFVLQPFLIPSESMEDTLLVGDFLLVNKQVYAPAGIWSRMLPYRPVRRGDIVVFRFPPDPKRILVKRVVAIPGDRLRILRGQVWIDGALLPEPWARFQPGGADPYRDNFPAAAYTDPRVDIRWWRLLQASTRNGELVIPPGQYFVLGDNRNDSLDSRYWGFVARDRIVARPLLIYFSLNRPSRDKDASQPGSEPTHRVPEAEAHAGQKSENDRLGVEADLRRRVLGFARWQRIFHVIR